MNNYNKSLRRIQQRQEETNKILEKKAKRRKVNWKSDIDSKLILYDEKSTNIDKLIDIPITINKAKLAHYNTKKELEDEMSTVYGSFFLEDKDLNGTTKSQWLTGREVIQKLYDNSKLGNHVFIPSALTIYQHGWMPPYDCWSHKTEYSHFKIAASVANRKNDMILFDTEMIAVDVDTHTIKPIDFIDTLPTTLKSILIGIIPTPSYGYTNEDGITTYGCRLLFLVPSLFDLAQEWNYKVDANNSISLLDYAEEKMYKLNKSELEKKGIHVELEYKKDEEWYNNNVDKKAGRIHYRKITLEIYRRMYNALVSYISSNTDIVVDADNNPDPLQLVRCGRGDYIVNCGVQRMSINQMVNLDEIAKKNKREEATETIINTLENDKDEIIDAYSTPSNSDLNTDSVSSPDSETKQKAKLHDDWIIRWASQVGYIADTSNWQKALLAIASLRAQERISDDDARSAAYAITNQKDYNAYDKWALKTVGVNPNPIDFPGQKYLMDIYIDNGGNKYDLYEIPPADNLSKSERDSKQCKIFANQFKSNYSQLTVDGQLDEETIAEYVLSHKGNTLLYAPTGSGKTQSIFLGITDFYKSNRGSGITIIAMPNVTNINQLQVKYGKLLDKMFFASASQGQYKNKKGEYDRAIRNAYYDGVQVYVVTYDSAKRVYGDIAELEPLVKLEYLVIDEAHQGVTSYGYRSMALDNLFELTEKAESMIGMSGTVSDINLDDYDRLVDVTVSDGDAIPAEEFIVLEHSNDKKLLDEMVRTVRGHIDRGSEQVLIFLEHKKSQQRLSKTLEKSGYSTIVVNADNKENEDVVELTSKEYIDRQVIIATSAISDGISLANSKDSVCIVVSSATSNIWSPTVIRQMSARYRNPYSRFIWMRPRIDTNDKNKRNGKVLSTQKYYSIKKEKAESLLLELEEMETYDNKVKGIPTVYIDDLEKKYRIKYDEYNTLYINYRGLYHDAYIAKNNAYAYHLITLQDDIAYMLGLDISVVYNNVNLLSNDVKIREEVDDEIRKKEKEKKENFIDNVSNIITPEVYYNILSGGEHFGPLDNHKKVRDFLASIPDGLRASVKANRYLPYDDFIQFCKSHLGGNRKMHWYGNTLQVYVDYIAYSKCGFDSKTKVIMDCIDETIAMLIEKFGVDKSQPKAGQLVKGEYLLKSTYDAIPDVTYDSINTSVSGFKINKKEIEDDFKKYYARRPVGKLRIFEKEKKNIYGEVVSGNEDEPTKQVMVCDVIHTYDVDYVLNKLGLQANEVARLNKMAYFYAKYKKIDTPQLAAYLRRDDYGDYYKGIGLKVRSK